jgi:hypothetical protein
VEELKRTLTALVAQRDASDLEKRHASQRELEQREVRFRVSEEFLKLRGRNEADPARWAAILEDGFTLTLPVTDFRDMVHSGDGSPKVAHEQVLTGVTEVMGDSTMCSAFLQGLTRGLDVVTLSYNCDRENFFMDNCTAMLEFNASTQGVVQQVRMFCSRVRVHRSEEGLTSTDALFGFAASCCHSFIGRCFRTHYEGKHPCKVQSGVKQTHFNRNDV